MEIYVWILRSLVNLLEGVMEITHLIYMGKIMNPVNTFMTIGSPKFLAAIFRPNKCFFRLKSFSAENFHVKFNGALEIRVQCFLDELFSRGKNIFSERLFGLNFYF